MADKPFCTCKKFHPATVFYQYDPVVGVCGACLKPFPMLWESFIAECDNCLSEFSNPYSDECERCDPDARSWVSVADQFREFQRKLTAEIKAGTLLNASTEAPTNI